VLGLGALAALGALGALAALGADSGNFIGLCAPRSAQSQQRRTGGSGVTLWERFGDLKVAARPAYAATRHRAGAGPAVTNDGWATPR
jgi:hypothetical protein